MCENTVPSPSVTKHNTVFFDVDFREEHFPVYSYKAHFLPMQGQLQPLAFRLSLRNIPGMIPMELRRREPRDQIFAVWWHISACSHQQRKAEGQVSESWLQDSDQPYGSKNEINKDPHEDLYMEKTVKNKSKTWCVCLKWEKSLIGSSRSHLLTFDCTC